VIGAGFIGAEVASSCRALGLEVTMIEAAPLPAQPSMPDPVNRRPTRFTRPPTVQVDRLTVPPAGSFPGVT